jgi:hypothetical protein
LVRFKDEYRGLKWLNLPSNRWNGYEGDLPQFMTSPDGSTVTVQYADGYREELPLF